MIQKWLLILGALGAGYMVLQSPAAFATAAGAVEKLTAGSVVAVDTGGKGKV